MATLVLPPVDTIPSLSSQARAAVLDALFEPCTALHTLTVERLKTEKFQSYPALVADVGIQLRALQHSSSSSDTAWLESILSAHPRLGAPKVDSAQSQGEQAQLQAGGEEQVKLLRDLNTEYEAKFPGLRYVVFVNGRSRPVIMENMRQRIDRADIEAEKSEAIQAMCDIALDRAQKLSG